MTNDVERFYAVAPIEMVDVRDSSSNDDNTWTMSGYAAVFGQQATLLDNQFERVTVSIAPEAFDHVLTTRPVVHFNRGHDMNTSVAATDVPAGQPGSLQLSVDQNGLRFLAKVSRDDPDGIALAAKMRSGVVRQASFAFTSQSEFTSSESADGREMAHRLITEITNLYDVCATPQGVFHQTLSQLETYAKQLGQPDVGGHHRQPGLGGDRTVNPGTEGRVAGQRDQSPLVLEMRRFMASERERLGYVFVEENHGRRNEDG